MSPRGLQLVDAAAIFVHVDPDGQRRSIWIGPLLLGIPHKLKDVSAREVGQVRENARVGPTWSTRWSCVPAGRGNAIGVCRPRGTAGVRPARSHSPIRLPEIAIITHDAKEVVCSFLRLAARRRYIFGVRGLN